MTGESARRAVVVAAASLCAAAAGGAAYGAANSASVPASADSRMQNNLRNVATAEETFFVDHLRYGTARELRTSDVGMDYLPLSSGQFVNVHLDGWMGFCLAGRVARHHFFVYDSENGGLRGPKRHDTCSLTVYPEDGGRLRP